MDEKNLLDLWNTKRSQIISAQMAPNLMLIGIFVLAAFGKFDGASDAAKYVAIGVAATTGILAMITQYATIREAEVLLLSFACAFSFSGIFEPTTNNCSMFTHDINM